ASNCKSGCSVCSACSRQVESWPPEKATTRRVPRSRRSGMRPRVASNASWTVAAALAKEQVEPLPPRWRRRWGWRGWRPLRHWWLLGQHHQRVIAGFDEAQLLACNRFDRAITARLLDLLLQGDVVPAQCANLSAQRVRLLVEAVVVERLLPGRDERVQHHRY